MASAAGSDTKDDKFNIPLEILINILSRVPARSIGRFRCVCKLWSSLTSDPYFIDLHLRNSPKSNPPCILFSTRTEDLCLDLTLIDHARVPNHSFPCNPNNKALMTNPCNGLIGFYDRSTMKLCNLTTQEVLTLPKYAEVTMDPFPSSRCYLGFHPGTKEYKLVSLSTRGVSTAEEDGLVCRVFTLGSGMWREIGTFHYKLWTLCEVAVNGAIYWLRLLTSKTVVSFDLKDERFIHIPFPDHEICKNSRLEDHFLVEEEGNVCLGAFSLSVDVWILKGETNHVWIHKYHVIVGQCGQCPSAPDYFHWPVIIREGKILLFSGHKLCYYDLRSQSVDCIEAPCIEDIDDILVYVDSLVSLGNIEAHASERLHSSERMFEERLKRLEDEMAFVMQQQFAGSSQSSHMSANNSSEWTFEERVKRLEDQIAFVMQQQSAGSSQSSHMFDNRSQTPQVESQSPQPGATCHLKSWRNRVVATGRVTEHKSETILSVILEEIIDAYAELYEGEGTLGNCLVGEIVVWPKYWVQRL